MHPEASNWVSQFATKRRVSVLDIGSRNINGTVRGFFPNADYIGIDLHEGDGVDVVEDVTKWKRRKRFDIVVCCEVLEHASNWKKIVSTAYERCADEGMFIVTCAGPGRAPHSAYDGGPCRKDEHYANIKPSELEKALSKFTSFTVHQMGEDVRGVAYR